MNFDIKVNGVTIKSPSSFKVDFNPISDGQRLLTGRMSVKGVAGKYKLNLSYDRIHRDEFIKLAGETWTKFRDSRVITQSVTFTHFSGSPITIDTYFSPHSITYTPVGLKNDFFENVSISFIEL